MTDDDEFLSGMCAGVLHYFLKHLTHTRFDKGIIESKMNDEGFRYDCAGTERDRYLSGLAGAYCCVSRAGHRGWIGHHCFHGELSERHRLFGPNIVLPLYQLLRR